MFMYRPTVYVYSQFRIVGMTYHFCPQAYVAYRGISQGDPYRLIYGVDSWGNVCDRKNEPIPGIPLSGRDMVGKM